MSPLVERALTVTDLCDKTLWSELDAPFRGSADPAPEAVRDELLAASVLIARGRMLLRAAIAHAARAGVRQPQPRLPPFHKRMPGMGVWVCSHVPRCDLHDNPPTTCARTPFPPGFIRGINIEARTLVDALPPPVTPTPEDNPS